jgi:hypothetical protein
VVGGSSILLESAVAVESEMVGNDSDALLIGGVIELRNNCSCALLAASNAAAADCASAFDFGVVEKNCAILLGFPDADLNKLPPFSFGGEKDGQGVGGELLRKGFDSRRGMARDLQGNGCSKFDVLYQRSRRVAGGIARNWEKSQTTDVFGFVEGVAKVYVVLWRCRNALSQTRGYLLYVAKCQSNQDPRCLPPWGPRYERELTD